MKAEDRIGQKFGRLVVQAVISKKAHGMTRVSCLCECGETTETTVQRLLNGQTRSCGCLSKESTKMRRTVHGKSLDGEYRSWGSMIQRCTNTNNDRYADYGGRGITVCKRWLKFENFYEDMGDRPSKDHSLDRIDNNGGYCKENCRWATRVEQQSNTRASRFVVHDGRSLTVTQWAAAAGLSPQALVNRLNLGWSMDKALTTLTRSRKHK